MHRGQVSYIQHHIVLDQTMDMLKQMQPNLSEEQLQDIRAAFEKQLPSKEADIAPGLVPNVMTGRIANRLNLKGPNYILDAACSSSLLAVGAAIDELRNGRSRMMLAGGVNATMPAEAFIMFTQLGALSDRGKVRSFSKGSNGTLLGEGLGVVCLKRVADALEDGDRIYAVIKGVGQSSDGKGQGLLAPSEEGETLAIQRAYTASGVDPATISLIEAHGTGIPLGDKTEVASLRNVLGDRQGEFGSVAMGSVKSMISHCIPAAGVAGLIKTSLALHHKVLPPTLCDEVNPDLNIEQTPLYVNTEPRPWIAEPNQPRRAGVNSFGFGGINTHAILEQAPEAANRPTNMLPWATELCVFSGATVDELLAQLDRVEALVGTSPDVALKDIAASLAALGLQGEKRAAMVVKDVADLAKKLKKLRKRLQEKPADNWSTRNGTFYCATPLQGELAFLFPGEGSQYLQMFADLAHCFSEVREWFDFWQTLYQEKPGSTRTDIVFPPASEISKEKVKQLEKRIHAMDVGSEAVFVAGQAMMALMTSLGVKPDVMVGHSSGESSALAASGMMGMAQDREQLGAFIRRLNQLYQQVLEDGKIPTGALLTVGALKRTAVEEIIANFNAQIGSSDADADGAVKQEILIAMDNCENQLVLFGPEQAIEQMQKTLSTAGGICAKLPFNRGYHTPYFDAMTEAFLGYYGDIELGKPQLPLYSCATAELFPADEVAVRETAASQWSQKVRFSETIEKMHRDGVRFFIEVGPSGNLTGFVNDVLAKKDCIAVATNQRKKAGLEQIQTVLAGLFVNGKECDINKLFADRSCQQIDLSADQPKPTVKPVGMPVANTMPVLRIDKQVSSLLVGSGAVNSQQEAAVVTNSESIQQVSAANQSSREYGHIEMPFLTEIRVSDEQILSAQCDLNFYDDGFLQDHVLSGVVSENDPELSGLSCVPLMVSVEILAEACAVLAGSLTVTAIENIQAFDWLALDEEDLHLNVQAQLLGQQGYRASIFNADNKVVTADFYFSDRLPQQERLPALNETRTFDWQPEEFYTTGMFHGPVFHSIQQVPGWSDEGIDAELKACSLNGFFAEGEEAALILNPVLLDALGQLVAFWIAQQVGTDFNSFPSLIKRIDLYQTQPTDLSGAVLRGRQRLADGASGSGPEAMRAWDIECVDAQGQPVLRASDWVNVFFAVPNRFYQTRFQPLQGWLGGLQQMPQTGEALVWRLEHLDEAFCAQSNGIFLRILAHAILSFEEREAWNNLQGSPHYKRQWLLGRACIKEAVRYWLYQQTGHLLYPADVEVLHDDLGAPYVDGWWCDAFGLIPEVSLSHDKQRSIAAVSPAHSAVGIDAEQLGRVRQPDLVADSFTANERGYLEGLAEDALQERLLRIWCAKEAAAKYLGSGLQGRPDAFEVSFVDSDGNIAQVCFEQETVDVVLSREGELIVAIANDTLGLSA